MRIGTEAPYPRPSFGRAFMFFDAVAFMDLTDNTHTRTVRISAAGYEK